MSEPAATSAEGAPSPGPRARHALLKRLADVVSLPASRVNAFERAVTGDLLVEMLRLAAPEDTAASPPVWRPWAKFPTAWRGFCCATNPRSRAY